MPLNLDLLDLTVPQMFFNSFENDEIVIQKGTFHTAYIECESKLISNHSDIYENSSLIEGSILIERNKNKYISLHFYENKTNFFYQIFECNQNNYSNNEYYASIDGMILEKLINNTSSFMKAFNQIEYYLKSKEEFLFNFYQSKSNEDDYNNLEKNSNPNFNISFISRNEIKIDIKPRYKSIDFDFYFLMGLDKKSNNLLSNKCNMEKLIKNNNVFNQENIIIKNIQYKNGKFINNYLKVTELKTGDIIHSNILGKGKIFEDVEEFIFYEEQNHKIEDSDFPEEEENTGFIGWIIAISIIIVIAFISFGLFLHYKYRKNSNVDVKIDSQRESLGIAE